MSARDLARRIAAEAEARRLGLTGTEFEDHIADAVDPERAIQRVRERREQESEAAGRHLDRGYGRGAA